ncbi:hypothetical protein BH09PSE4_BH09PSE4_19230 [soil metagenome]
MPAERGYEQQAAPGVTPGLPQASAASFGAGVGQGIDELGGALHARDVEAYKLERRQTADAEAADFNARFAATREELDRASIDARNGAAPGGAGHADAMAKLWAERKAALLDGITEDSVRRSAVAQADEFGSRFQSAEYQFEAGARIGKMATDQQAASDLGANRARRMHDPAAYREELSLGRQAIDSLEGVPDDVKQKLHRYHDETVTIGFINGLNDTNPKNAMDLLDAGKFDDILTPEQIDRARDGAQVEMRRADAAARAQQAHETSVAKDQLGAIEADLNAGAGTLADRQRVAEQYAAIGDQSKAAEWRGKATEFAVVQDRRADTLPQMDQQIAALEAKRSGGGLAADEAHRLNGLKDLRSQSAARLEQPGGALLQLQYATGRPLAALDVHDFATFEARGQQARVAAPRYGRTAIEPILATELPAFKDLMDGPNGRLQAIDAIQHFRDARTIAGAARQMAGAEDGEFRIAALLPHDVARDVLRVAATLKANPQVWNERTASHDFASWYGPALSWVGGSYRNDIFQAAKAFYAQRASDGHEQAYNPGRFAEAIETVLGRSADGKGGVARTAQGIVLAPAGVDPQTMMRTFARATPSEYAQAAGGRTPRWSDGSPITVAQFKQLLPTQVADGHYGFRGRNNQLIHDDQGNAYTVELSRLPRR